MKPTRLFVPSKGKPETIKIVHYFKRHNFNDYTVVVCHDDDTEGYKRTMDGLGEVIACPERCKTLSAKNEWVIKNHVASNEWLAMAQDNITAITKLEDNVNKEISPQEYLSVLHEDIDLAEKKKAVLGGFASNSNPFFRTKKYRYVGFVWSKLAYYKNVGLDWLKELKEMDDYAYTAIALLNSGCVVINNHIYPNCKRFEKIGGTGTYANRIQNKRMAVSVILSVFPDLYRKANRPKLDPHSELRMRLNCENSVEKWKQGLNP